MRRWTTINIQLGDGRSTAERVDLSISFTRDQPSNGPTRTLVTNTAVPSVDPALRTETAEDEPGPRHRKRRTEGGSGVQSRRRFTTAVLVGMGITVVPYLWVLLDLWNGSFDLLRKAPLANNFYDLQARSMMHGHFFVPHDSIGIEAFLHNGREYTYFGLFPSILRMPVLIFTHALDGKLTALSMLLAWLCTGLFSALLLWRVRTIVRGSALLGRAEAASYGILMAAITGGSVLVLLAATPYVYDEDFGWSVALTVGALFALLGVLERPSRGRVVLAGVFILAANLNRTPTGWACVIGAVLVAVWFALGRGGKKNRRWAAPMVAAGLVPLAIAGLVGEAKFGSPFGFSLTDQVYTQMNAHRRYYLSTTGGKGYSLRFIPSTMLAYFGPAGLRFTGVFPFITLPAAPAKAVGGVVLEWQYRTESATASMPLLFLLSIAGSITALRRRSGAIGLVRIPVLAGLLGCAGVVVWGYLAPRYLADFMPFFIIASAVGLTDIWRRVDLRFGDQRRTPRRVLLGSVAVLGVFGIVANLGLASTPNDEWSTTQSLGYVQMQKSISDSTGQPLVGNILRGSVLPPWAPADKVFIVNNCRALYVSNGMNYSNAPKQVFEHATWMPVQQGTGIVYDVTLEFRAPADQIVGKVPILAIGRDTLWIASAGSQQVAFGLDDPHVPAVSAAKLLPPNFAYPVELIVDPYLRTLSMSTYGHTLLDAEWPNGAVSTIRAVPPIPGGYPYTISVQKPKPDVGFCRSLLQESRAHSAAAAATAEPGAG